MSFRTQSKDLAKRTRAILAQSKTTYESISYNTATDELSRGLIITFRGKTHHEELAHKAALDAFCKDFRQLSLDIQTLFGGRPLEISCYSGRHGQNTPKITFSLLDGKQRHAVANNITSQTITKTLVTLAGFFEVLPGSVHGHWAEMSDKLTPGSYSLKRTHPKPLVERTLLEHLTRGPIAPFLSSQDNNKIHFHSSPSVEIQSLCSRSSPQNNQKQKDNARLCHSWIQDVTQALKTSVKALGDADFLPAISLIISVHQPLKVTSHQPLSEEDQKLVLDELNSSTPELEQLQELVNTFNGTLTLEHNIRGNFVTCRLYQNEPVDTNGSSALTHDAVTAGQMLSVHMWNQKKEPSWYAAFYDNNPQGLLVQADNPMAALQKAVQTLRCEDQKDKVDLYQARILNTRERTKACQDLQNALAEAASLFS